MSQHKFAIVDIETTGGYANQNGITEIAIILFDGVKVEGKFSTLVNPLRPIQPYVQSMTGITDAMVAKAPLFTEVAENIHNLLKDRIFVAHNVNFDYSFVRHQLQQANFFIDLPKICTVRLARKVFPGLVKYGLGSLCKEFGIENNARHRAIGDAEATTILFSKMLESEVAKSEIAVLTKKRKAAQYLPPNLTSTALDNISSLPGVYYFHDKKGKIIYVGEAINLKKRVSSHFSNNKISKQKQDFLRDIYNISFKECSSDLVAAVFESTEIKRLWPIYNKSQKHYEKKYGIFAFEDSKGYLRLGIDIHKKILQPLLSLNLIVDARNVLTNWCNTHDINPWLFFLSKEAPEKLPKVKEHNKKVEKIIASIDETKKDFLVHDGANTYFLMIKGKFSGMQKFKRNQLKLPKQELINLIDPLHDNNVANSIILNYIEANQKMVIELH